MWPVDNLPSEPEINLQNVTPDVWIANTAQCSRLMEKEENWQSVPLFNYMLPENLKNHQFIRYRGMIQNMHNSEFFLNKYEVRNNITGELTVRSGKLRDWVTCEENEIIVEDSKHKEWVERETWFCVPIPALNDWVSLKWKKPQLKRPHCKSVDEEGQEPPRKIYDCQQSEQPSTSAQENLEMNLADSYFRSCLLKLYDVDTSSYALNEIIEVAGFLSLCNYRKNEGDEMDVDENVDINVPHLHVVACKNVSQNSSLLSELSSGISNEELQSARSDMHLLLTQLLLGDTLAADYILCHLLSSVYSRTDMMALGQLPLNIINIPNGNYVKNFYKIIQLLVAKSVFLPLSLENLNTNNFIPKKDYEKDQLCGGLLQLSPQTHLVLDETQMQPGKLDTHGIANISALRRLVLEQKVAYDFQYHLLDFNCDIPVLVFSEGKSLLPCSIVLPLEFDPAFVSTIQEMFQAAHHFLQPSMLERLRAFILSVQSRSKSFTIDSEMQQIIQEDFVKLRQNKDTKTSPDDLHNLIGLGRLMSMSFGEHVLTAKTWQNVMKLEEQRKQRVH